MLTFVGLAISILLLADFAGPLLFSCVPMPPRQVLRPRKSRFGLTIPSSAMLPATRLNASASPFIYYRAQSLRLTPLARTAPHPTLTANVTASRPRIIYRLPVKLYLVGLLPLTHRNLQTLCLQYIYSEWNAQGLITLCVHSTH